MAVKFGVALGAHVTVISRGPGKKDEAINRLGAHAFVDSTDAD
jgi:D-arabinose 1-dehydrogenase-like Zn-dependent alcohol dehydrogenase